MHEELVSRLVKLSEENLWLGDRPDMIIAVDWDAKNQIKPPKIWKFPFRNSADEVLMECN